MEKWVVSAKRADFKGIAERFGIDQVTARVIRNRDIVGDEAIREYLFGTVADLHDPALMKGMARSVSLLRDEIRSGKKIRILGDYDIDGVQSVYILYTALRRCGADVDFVIPDRVADGYGMNERLVRRAKEDGADMILTCDNGIAAYREIALAKELGMDVIVTDHHEVPYEDGGDGERRYILPPADAIVNPKQPGCPYPFKKLCGAAISLKLVQALYADFGFAPEEALAFLENAAFATVGDVMDLIGENRTLVREGLRALNRTQNPGIRALAARNGIPMGGITAYHIGFVLGPCINATGRLDTARRALRLLLAEDEKEAGELAEELYGLNASRKEMTERGFKEAMDLIETTNLKDDKVLVIYLEDCHESIAGIIAGRVREKINRPVFILTKGEEGIKGSGRSIEAYSMYDEMTKCKELFTRFGGHPMAAGLSMPEGNVDLFRKRLNENAALTEEDFQRKIVIDVPMPLDYVTKQLVEELSRLEPFGKANEKPLFADKDIRIRSMRVLGEKRNVVRMEALGSGGTPMPAILFGQTEEFLGFLREKFGPIEVDRALAGQENGIRVSFAYYPEINVFHGRESLQAVVRNYC